MPERNMAYIILDFQDALKRFKVGTINIETLTQEFETMKHRVGGAVARYCDDFSSSDYRNILRELEGTNATD